MTWTNADASAFREYAKASGVQKRSKISSRINAEMRWQDN